MHFYLVDDDPDILAMLTRTQIGENAYLKTRFYRTTFKNGLFSYDNASQTTQTLPRAFRSYYDDVAYGGNVELGFDVTSSNTLKAAAFYRRYKHVEWQQSFSPPLVEPRQTTTEDTTSIALEDTQRFGEAVELVVGVSRDRRDLSMAEDFNANAFVFYPLTSEATWNGQAALVWRPTATSQVHASVSSRTRFPTIFERFSSRFGTAIPNPSVKSERALNVEIGGKMQIAPGLTVEGAVFHSDLEDALIQIPVALGPPFGTVTQTRNVGDGEYYGAELSVTAVLSPSLSLGGNYTWLHRKFTDPTNPTFRPLGVPDQKLFAYLDWRPLDRLTLTPSVEVTSDRWTVTSSSLITPPRYYKTGEYLLLGLGAQVQVTSKIDLLLSARNLLDQQHQLVDGFPEEGRNFRADLRIKF